MSTAPVYSIGIDLGITFSRVGVMQHDRVVIIANEQGNYATPSYVAFTETECLVGEAAKNQADKNPCNTVYGIKSLIGRKFSDASVQAAIKCWPFTVIEGPSNKPMIRVTFKGEVREFSPEEILSMILMNMKHVAEVFLGSEVSNAVITVPVYFNKSQLQATKSAIDMSGIRVLYPLNEPHAAVIAYGLDKQNQTVLVFELGGGKIDVSLVENAKEYFDVKAAARESHLGGEDFNDRLVEYLSAEFERMHKKNITGSQRALRRLRDACEKVKLTSRNFAIIEIDSLFEGIDFITIITKAKFDDLNMDIFRKCIELIGKVIKDSKIPKREVDEIVLIGGSSRIPKVQELISEFFNGKKLKISINPEETVAHGATIRATNLCPDSIEDGIWKAEKALKMKQEAEVRDFKLKQEKAEAVRLKNKAESDKLESDKAESDRFYETEAAEEVNVRFSDETIDILRSQAVQDVVETDRLGEIVAVEEANVSFSDEAIDISSSPNAQDVFQIDLIEDSLNSVFAEAEALVDKGGGQSVSIGGIVNEPTTLTESKESTLEYDQRRLDLTELKEFALVYGQKRSDLENERHLFEFEKLPWEVEKKKIAFEKVQWDMEKAKISQICVFESDEIDLNIGGHCFTTTLTTLTRFPDSLLGEMFSGRHVLQKNKIGAYFMDRDGTHFRHILNFLRAPNRFELNLEINFKKELKIEADFYGLSDQMFSD